MMLRLAPVPGDLAPVELGRVEAGDADVSLCGEVLSVHQTQHGGFARTRVAGEEEELAFGHVER
jgi:hypothetical protein